MFRHRSDDTGFEHRGSESYSAFFVDANAFPNTHSFAYPNPHAHANTDAYAQFNDRWGQHCQPVRRRVSNFSFSTHG